MQIVTRRLSLDPLRPEDADEMVDVLSDERLYSFIGGHPPSLDSLRAQYRGMVVGRSPDRREEWLNWIVRRRSDGRAVGTVQATIDDDGRRADIAWIIGRKWQGQGIASEAARALVIWLDERGVVAITAHIHPDHAASAAVAARAGLSRSGDLEAGEEIWRSTPTPG